MKVFIKIVIASISVLGLINIVGCKKGSNENNNSKPDYQTHLDNNIVAHRGGSTEAGGTPDNSIASLRYAIGLGCYASECDIYVTKDDSLIVCHSESNDDAIFKGRVIHNTSFQEMKSLKLSNGESVPSLSEYITEVMSSPFTKLWLDIKSIGANTQENNDLSSKAGVLAARLVKEMGAQSRVAFIVGRKPVLDACIAEVGGAWDVGYMNSGYSAQQFSDAGYKWANFDLKNAFYNNLEAIQSYKDMGIKVSVFNADSDEEMNFFLNQSMNWICTNYPQKLLKKIREK